MYLWLYFLDMTCAIEPKKEEAEDSPWDSEVF
jgi:hypothetical protein